MISVEFPVYGKDINEIETRANMVSRRFLGSYTPTAVNFDVEPLVQIGTGEIHLRKADVTVHWDPDDL